MCLSLMNVMNAANVDPGLANPAKKQKHLYITSFINSNNYPVKKVVISGHLLQKV